MVRKNSLLITLMLFAGVFFVTPIALAQRSSRCQSIHNGGGTTCPANGALTITKTIQDPRSKVFVPNLLQNDYIFSRNETITFHLTVDNMSNNTVNGINIMDTLPANLDYIGGDGTFDTDKRTISILLPSLAAKNAKTYTIQTQVNKIALPDNASPVCLTNQALIQTKYFFFFTSVQNQTNAIFCIRKEALRTVQQTTQSQPAVFSLSTTTQTTGQGTTKGGKQVFTPTPNSQTPPTGPETWGLLALLPICFMGIKLRKITLK